jgi:putative endonuclease
MSGMTGHRSAGGSSTAARGREGEQAAAAWLSAGGWTIIERNFRTPLGEIDIIATRDATVAFIEVKSWSALPDSALEHSIDHRKQVRIARAARLFLSRHPALLERSFRFDVLFLDQGAHSVRHIENAFNGGID